MAIKRSALGNIVVVWGGVYLVMLDHYWLVHRRRVLYLYAVFCSKEFLLLLGLF